MAGEGRGAEGRRGERVQVEDLREVEQLVVPASAEGTSELPPVSQSYRPVGRSRGTCRRVGAAVGRRAARLGLGHGVGAG